MKSAIMYLVLLAGAVLLQYNKYLYLNLKRTLDIILIDIYTAGIYKMKQTV